MELQAAKVEVGDGTVGAGVGTPVVPSSLTSTPTSVEAAVELQVDELSEAGRADAALVRLLPRVQTLVRFQVAGAAEALVTHLKEKKRNEKKDEDRERVKQREEEKKR